MPFSYYKQLKAADKKIYRQSDQITAIRLPLGDEVHSIVKKLGRCLSQEDWEQTRKQTKILINTLADGLHVPRVRVEVLQVRPSNHDGELHGLYNPQEQSKSPRITVWMRTAKRRQIVAFRTFLRTLIHEFCHHLDYTLFRLEDSFHTEGFYKRESSLMHQLLPPQRTPQKIPSKTSVRKSRP